MGGQTRIAAFLAAFTVSCGGQKAPRQVERPTLETLAPVREGTRTTLGEAVAPGFFRPCQIVVASTGNGLVELNCDEYQVVEFRKPKSGGSGDADLDALMTVLGARFGELRESRRDATIDALVIRLSDFATIDDAGPRGMAASVSNSAGQYWAFACYRKGGTLSKGFCGDAIATAARAGGLAYVEARELEDFGDGKLKVAASCTSTPGSKITCPTGELSWSPKGDRGADTLRDETLARLREMATKEKVKLKERELACKLLGAEASCLYVGLTNKSGSEALHFVLATGGEQERLVVCSYPETAAGALPEPCKQAIELSLPDS